MKNSLKKASLYSIFALGIMFSAGMASFARAEVVLANEPVAPQDVNDAGRTLIPTGTPCDDCDAPVVNDNNDLHGIVPPGQQDVVLTPVAPVVVPPTKPADEVSVVVRKERKVRRSSGGSFVVRQDAPVVAPVAPKANKPVSVILNAPKQNKTAEITPKQNKPTVADSVVSPKENTTNDVVAKEVKNESNIPVTASAADSFGDKFLKFFSDLWHGFLNLF